MLSVWQSTPNANTPEPSNHTYHMPDKLDNARLEQITELVSADVRTLIAESEKEILKDYHTVVEEAQDEGKDKMPSLKLGISVDFDPEKNNLQTKISWTVKKTRSTDHQLEDLTQGKLEFVAKN
jgi:hypothetical protein